jgi:signal transduction histidine kinase
MREARATRSVDHVAQEAGEKQASAASAVMPRRRPRVLFDVALAAVLTALFLLAGVHIQAHGARHLDALGYSLLVVAGVSMAFARRRPHAVVVVITVVLAVYYARDYPNGPVLATGWISLLALSWRTDRRTALTGAVVMCAVLSVVVAVAGDGPPIMPAVFVGWSAAAVFLGDALRNRRGYLAELEEHARYLERTREEEARRQVAEERLRIARDLHDSVAHAMATINVQAGAAAHVMERRPEVVRDALGAIQRASGDVLDELAAILALLRDDQVAASRAPTPHIADIAGLVDGAAAAGLPVSLTVDGPVGDVSPSISTAAYRIVQESLTNAMKHAGPANVEVAVRATPDGGLTVRVADDGRGTSSEPAGAGRGITGMRERADSTGGRLTAGPRPGGGFVVHVQGEGRQ